MNELHLQPAEKLAHYSGKTSRTVIDVEKAIKDLHETAKDKRVETLGFSGVVRASKRQTDVLNKIQEGIETPKKVVQKLDEVKSAALVTNQKLDKLYKKEAPAKMKVEIEGAEMVTIKGAKGDKGDKGDVGERGEKGDKGEQGIQGMEGKKGTKGDRGEEGKQGVQGLKGFDGKDGDNGNPADEKKIIKEILKKIPDHVGDVMNQRGYSTGGANQITVKNNGIRVSDFYTDLNFTSGISTSYSNGVISISASGSGTGSTILYVSSRGLANGLATTTNDGMAYGPDTPGTTTCGIQEAINALPTVSSTGEPVGGGQIILGQGQFICSGQIILPVTYQYEIKITGTGWHSAQLHSTGTIDFMITDQINYAKRSNIILEDFKIVDATADQSTKRHLIRIQNSVNQGAIRRVIVASKEADAFIGVGNGGVTGQGGSDLYIGGVTTNAKGTVGIRIDGGFDNKWVISHVGGYGLAAGIIYGPDHGVIEDTMMVACGKWWTAPQGAQHTGTAWTAIATPGNHSQALNNVLSYGAGIILNNNLYDIHCNRNYTMESSCAFFNLNYIGFGPQLRITEPYCENVTEYYLLNSLDENGETFSGTSIFRQLNRGSGNIGYLDLTTGTVGTNLAPPATVNTPASAYEFVTGGLPSVTSDYFQYKDLIKGISLLEITPDGDIIITGSFLRYNKLTATGTINDSNTAFTFTQQPYALVINRLWYLINDGWTWNAGTLTANLTNPVGTGGVIWGYK